MSLVKFTCDRRPHHGYEDVFVNPADVVSIVTLHDDNNKSSIRMRSGLSVHVNEWPDAVVKKLDKAPAETERKDALISELETLARDYEQLLDEIAMGAMPIGWACKGKAQVVAAVLAKVKASKEGAQ